MRFYPQILKSIYFSLLYLITCQFAVAAGMDPEKSQPEYRHGFYGGVGFVGIDEDKAFEQGVDDSAIIFDIGYIGTVGDHFSFLAGIYIPLIDDEDQFSQTVENNFGGDISNESSDISAWGILLEASGRLPLNDVVSLGGAVGMRTLTADREIAYCSDCYSEDIDLDGGSYMRPYLSIRTSHMFSFEISYISFFSGDFTDGPQANFVWSIW